MISSKNKILDYRSNKSKYCAFLLSFVLLLALFIPSLKINLQAMENFKFYITVSLFDKDGNQIEVKRNNLSQYKIAPMSNPSVTTNAYLAASAFTDEGVDSSLVSSNMLPAEFVYDGKDTEALKKVNEDMEALSIQAPTANQIVFAYDSPLVDTNILVELSSYKLDYWTYSTFTDKNDVLSDGSILVPGSNVGIGLGINMYFSKEGTEGTTTVVNGEKVEILPNETQSESENSEQTKATVPKVSASFDNLRSLLNDLETYLPSLPSRNGYRASIKLKQVQQVANELRSKASTTAEQELLKKADELITKTKQKLKVTTVVNLPATGEAYSSIIVIVILALLIVALIVIRKLINRRH